MISYLFLQLICDIFDVLSGAIIPSLPPNVINILNTVFDYMEEGLNWVGLVLPLDYCARLIEFWLLLYATLFVIEIAYGIWHKISGNSREEAKND